MGVNKMNNLLKNMVYSDIYILNEYMDGNEKILWDEKLSLILHNVAKIFDIFDYYFDDLTVQITYNMETENFAFYENVSGLIGKIIIWMYSINPDLNCVDDGNPVIDTWYIDDDYRMLYINIS